MMMVLARSEYGFELCASAFVDCRLVVIGSRVRQTDVIVFVSLIWIRGGWSDVLVVLVLVF